MPNGWLSGGGHVGHLMRSMDWTGSPLGPPEDWARSLKTVVDLVLGSKFPMFVAWGENLAFLYNDAYAEILGEKHPKALGGRFREIWSEIWPDIWPLIEAAMRGEASFREDLPLLMNRHGYDELTWFTFSYSPVRDDDGAVAGMFCACFETTDRVRSQSRQAFLFELDDALRELKEPAAILVTAAEMLGRQLQADRVHWARVDHAADRFVVEEEWAAPGAASLVGNHRLSDFGEPLIERMRQGHTVCVSDTHKDALAAGMSVEDAFGPNLRGAISSPMIRGGRWEGALCVHTHAPRMWRGDEANLVREVAERAWEIAQRAGAEARVRESEERLRALLNATSDVVYRMSADWRELRQLDGRGFLTDTEGPIVAWLDEYIFDTDHPRLMQAVDEAVATGVFQLEHRVRRADGEPGWVFSRAVPIKDADGEIVEWFGAASDVTARKRAEEHLALMVNELNHRVKNNLAMTQAIALQTFRNAGSLGQAETDFSARIKALAQANDLLTGERWVSASMRGVIEQALEAHCADGSGRCAFAGPEIGLTPKTALSLSLALHELATNASKYGAWSNGEGRVALHWGIEGERLRLEWRETGGPPVAQPTRRGFGSRLIERGLAAEMGGTVVMLFEPTGLVCKVDAPLSIVLEV